MATRICFVTNELYPVAPGGIGRLMYNFAVRNQTMSHGAELHYLFPESALPKRPALEAALGALARVHFCDISDRPADPFGRGLQFMREDEGNFEQVYLLSLRYLFGLQQAQCRLGVDFDIIEFPDFGGLAYATLQAKASGMDFSHARIAVRLHSSFGLISAYERFYHRASEYAGALCDQERYCIETADLVVAHLACIGDENARHYGLAPEWRARVIVEFPPILAPVSAGDGDELGFEDTGQPVFVFSSRLQPFKRPDCFINAAIRLLRRDPATEAMFLLTSYGWDDAYIDSLVLLIPQEYGSRIRLSRSVSESQRQAILRRGIIVIPSDYESLCLFAYEAAMLGRPVILNRACAAFGQCERWQDGKNCLFFEGDFVGLAAVMEKAMNWRPRETVSMVADPPYWLDVPSVAVSSSPARRGNRHDDAALSAHIVALHDGGGRSLSEFCLRLAGTRTEGAEVTIWLPDGHWSRTGKFAALAGSFRWHVAYYGGATPRPAELQAWLENISSDILVFVPLGAALDKNFIRLGLRCMTRQPGLAIFATHARLVDDFDRLVGLALSPGQLPSVALLRTPAFAGACMIRRSALLKHPLDERARDLWLETACRELVLNGAGMIVAPTSSVSWSGPPNQPRSNKLIDTTLWDEAGLRSKLLPRLLAVDAAFGLDTWQATPTRVLSGRDLAVAQRALPATCPVEFEPVSYQEAAGTLLVHPIAGRLVVAHLPLALHARFRRVECVVRNAHALNAGFEVTASLRPEPWPPEAIGNLETYGPGPEDWADWLFVVPESSGVLNLPAARLQRGDCHLYIATRTRPGASANYAWAQLESLRVY